MNFERLLKFGVDQGASAIHLQAEATPEVRIGGLMRNVEGPRLKAEELRAFIASVAPKSVADDLDRSLGNGAVFSTSTAAARFRCTTFSHIGGPGLVLRVVPSTIPSLEELNLPKVVRDVALASKGLVLVVGPGGSGKTTTLAAMVNLINGASYQKVVTIEDPVEYLFTNKKAMKPTPFSRESRRHRSGTPPLTMGLSRSLRSGLLPAPFPPPAWLPTVGRAMSVGSRPAASRAVRAVRAAKNELSPR